MRPDLGIRVLAGIIAVSVIGLSVCALLWEFVHPLLAIVVFFGSTIPAGVVVSVWANLPPREAP